MEIRLVGAELFHADGQTDRQTNFTEAIPLCHKYNHIYMYVCMYIYIYKFTSYTTTIKHTILSATN